MKKLLSLSLAIIMMFSMAVSVFAAENENIDAVLDRKIKVTYNGELQTFTDVNGKIVYPIVFEGTTYLPVRAASALVKLPVQWDGANYTVVLGGDGAAAEPAAPVDTPLTESENIKTTLDKNIKVTYNGELQTFTDVNGKVVYPIVHEGTTYLPVRAVSGLVNLPVEWDGANYTVVLGEKPEQPVAPPAAEPSKLVGGTWNGLVYTNDFASVKYTADENTEIYSEEYIAEHVGTSTESLLNDFCVVDRSNNVFTTIRYRDISRNLENAGSIDTDALAYLFAESWAKTVSSAGLGYAVRYGNVTLNGVDYSVAVIYMHTGEIEYSFYRVFDEHYLTNISMIGYDEVRLTLSSMNFNHNTN